MKLALGTVQFGLDYGIANASGRTPTDEVARILDCARQAGIDTLDTAAAYGHSEQVLGGIGVEGWKVVSKVPPMPEGVVDGRAWVREHARRSLDTLKVDRLAGLMLHSASDLLKPHGPELAAGLKEAKDMGLADKIGYSIYAPHSLAELTSIMQPDLVQAPFSVLDQRLATSGWLARLVDAGVEVHARSIFLQGLLLMAPGQRPAIFERWRPLWRRWDALVEAHGGSALSVCLGFAAMQSDLARIVVGVEHQGHLQQLLAAWRNAAPISMAQEVSCEDPLLVEPFNWTHQ